MARVKLTEFSTKRLLFSYFDFDYLGCFVDSEKNISDQIQRLDRTARYVVKVDQGVKKRFKNGLVVLDVGFDNLADAIKELLKKNYSNFIIEPFVKYDASEERYFSLERVREGCLLRYSVSGGVGIEEHAESVYEFFVRPDETELLENNSRLNEVGAVAKKLIEFIDCYYISFLEINPFLFVNRQPIFLDAACEVDDAGEFFVEGAWSSEDFARGTAADVLEVAAIRTLDEGSQASLKLELLNKDGSLFMLLSGGGASIVLADQLYDLGLGKEIANYGEYSGNPNDEETYTYAKNVISLLLKSQAKKRAIVIAGGVANFTDIRKTFRGIIRALSEHAADLRAAGVKVFVRRGGPYQKEGLAAMKSFLEKENLLGSVHGPELVLTDVVKEAAEFVTSG